MDGAEVPVLDAGRISRLRDVLAGGHLANEPDRELARSILERWPGTAANVKAANDFHRRAALWAVTGGTADSPCDPAAGVIFAAAGYPIDGGFHRAAAALQPKALFGYAEADEVAVAYNQALLAKREPLRVSAYLASARDPAGLLGTFAAAVILDRGPVMVQLQLCCHWWPAEFCVWVLGEYRRLLPSGSSLALSVGVVGGATGFGEFAAQTGLAGTGHPHTAEDVAGWVAAAGLTMTSDGVTDVRGRGWAEAELKRQKTVTRIVEAIAEVP
jgi:hypothetical protein